MSDIREQVHNRRAVVSVDLSAEEFEQIAAEARSLGLTTADFLRKCAIASCCKWYGIKLTGNVTSPYDGINTAAGGTTP